jgi:hypothetical protein
VSHTTISPQVFLWAQLSFVWAVASYAIISDPFSDEKEKKQSRKWWVVLVLRSVVAAAIAMLMSHSFTLGFAILVGVAALPIIRTNIPTKSMTELECIFALSFIGFMLWYVQHFKLALHSELLIFPLSKERLAAVCLVGVTLLFTVRGGTYMVRGLLKRADTLPHENAGKIDTIEVSRGRLIGNIERLMLTIVVAAGSYAGFGFLIAAKGFIRAEDLKKGRDFTEYFLVGSLASVLVALCAGLVIRFVLVALWPELLSLQMQSS